MDEICKMNEYNLKEYKINIFNRNYTEWSIYENYTFCEITDKKILDKISPLEQKLMNDDIFIFDEFGNICIIHSTCRLSINIPSVLVLDGNKSYGRFNKSKLYYKCIPDDTRLPPFLVPYEIQCGFSKVFQNKYVLIKFSDWSQKQPYGIISQTIGDVNILNNFYEYQLYCKSLNYSIQNFQKQTTKCLLKYDGFHSQIISDILLKYGTIEDRTNYDVLTIDTLKTTDFDDAFSYKEISNDECVISVYISNVPILLDYFNLWESFSNRIATIYLPDKKRPMLPSILSDNLCSLKSGELRIVLTLDIHINTEYEIIRTSYSNSLINVSKNYIYDDELLMVSDTYLKTYETIRKLSKKYNYINNVKNSHDLISYLMILTNYCSAKELLKYKKGIFRTNTNIINNVKLIPINIPDDVKKSITIWNSSISQYINIEENDEDVGHKHDSLCIDSYIHITSPIRRLVDLLNIICIQKNLNIVSMGDTFDTGNNNNNNGNAVDVFYKKWIDKIEYINVTMRNIRKIQNECNLLAMCSEDITMYEKKYDGYCFNKMIRSGGLFQYNVYLPELKMTSKIVTRIDMEEYTNADYKIYVFQDEDRLKKKIRISIE
jgi:exoribonuclease R